MDFTWSLNELYEGFETEEFKTDLANYNLFKDEFSKWADAELTSCDNAYEKIKTYIDFRNKGTSFRSLLSFCHLTLSVESENTFALKNLIQIQNIQAELSKPTALFKSFLKQVDNLSEIIDKNPCLKEYEFVLKEMKESTKHQLTKEEEILLSKLEITGSSSWAKLYNQAMSSLTVDYPENGEIKQITLSEVRSLSSDKNPEVRKNAFESEIKAYEKVEKQVASALNAIKGEAITVSKARGYESVLDMTLKKSRLEKEALDAMFSAIKESLPKFWAYLRHKGELLGDKGGIKYYNIMAPVGLVQMEFTYQEAVEYVINNFRKFSDKLANFTKMAYEKRWIDVYPRQGKRSGAFCSGLQPQKESRIMMNFSGSFSSMSTLAHELGHAYHNECMKDLSILNRDVPMPLAETASTFCETLICNEALKNATAEEKLFILDNSIMGVMQVCVDIYSRFLFEDAVICKRQNEILSSKELKEIMEESILTAYGEGINQEILHPYMWVCKGHYYDAGRNYYNFPYAYGQLFANGLYSMYLEEGSEFIQKYDKILESTGNHTLKDVGLLCGIDITDKNFWKKSLKITEDLIDEFLKLD